MAEEQQQGNGDSRGEAVGQQGGKPRTNVARGKTQYLVYEATKIGTGGRADEMRLLGQFTGEEEKDARWAAVDATEGLSERAADEEQKNPVYLLAIPISRATPRVTKEEVEVKKVRR